MRTLKVMVIGTDRAGKTAFIDTISEFTNVIVSTGRSSPRKPQPLLLCNMPAPDFGRITVDDDLVMYLFGLPYYLRRYHPAWHILIEGAAGLVMIVDSTRPETFRESRALLTLVSCYALVPRVIVANKQDLPDAVPVTDSRFLQAKPHLSDKLIPCVATDKDSVREVLLELLWMMETPRQSS